MSNNLDSIKGVGNSKIEKLESIDITTVNELANSSVEELEEVGIRGAESILAKAKRKGVVMKSSSEMVEEDKHLEYVSTGIDSFDDSLGGGMEPGFLVGVSGEHSAGKTQFVFQSLVSAAKSTDKPVVYIETEPKRFQASRIKQIAGEDSDIFDNIYKIEAYSLDQQRIAYDAVRENLDDVGLIAVDSFVANFRLSGEFEGRGDFKKRSNMIANHLKALQDLATDLECPVMVTLQVYGNPTQYDNTVPIWGGAKLHHTITCLFHMSHGKGELREIQLKGHPGMPDDEITVVISENGVVEPHKE